MTRYSLLAMILFLLTFSVVAGVPDHLTLTWTGDTATTMTVTWRTEAAVTSGRVQYQTGATLTANTKEAPATSREFPTDLGLYRLHTATMAGLTARTSYVYRVGDGIEWSEPHAFTTVDPQAEALTFLVFGDSQSVTTGKAPYALWRETLHAAANAHPQASFLVSTGDLVDVGQSLAHWEAWFAAAAGVIDTIPILPVVGNHETSGLPGSRRPAYWSTQFALPPNGPEGVKGQAYSLDCGPVHIAVIDSQHAEQRAYGDLLTPQAAWLDADLAAATTRWKIVVFHKPVYGVKAAPADTALQAALCPIIERHHADLVISGHEHGVSRTYPMRDGRAAEGLEQGTVYYIAGRSGSKTYADLNARSWTAFFHNPLDQPNYLAITITGPTLTVKALKLDGTLIDSCTLTKTGAG